jgi:hypothetical protein
MDFSWTRYISPWAPGMALSEYEARSYAQKTEQWQQQAAQREAEQQQQLSDDVNKILARVSAIGAIVIMVIILYYLFK